MLEQFHFVYPLWLLALLPLATLVWLLKKRSSDDNAWQRVVDPNLLPLLLSNGEGHNYHATLWLLGIGWLIAVLALADPTWEKRPQPLFETLQARVIVLDLSRSMNSSDLKPSRLFQARLKVEDILDRKDEGQTGLVVFAGDAFSVVPLTRDAKTIRAMLRVLQPELMPAQGSRADLGLEQAGKLLQQAGVPRGDILLITDGIQSDAAIDQANRLNRQGYRVSVLGVGTEDGAGVPAGKAGTLHDQQGNPVIARLNEQKLRRLAAAGGGRYARLQGSEHDLDQLLAPPSRPQLGSATETDKSELTSHRWKEQGPLLALLLLPLGALAFRRGWLLSLLLVSTLVPITEQADAAGWEDLWKRQDQQAGEALSQGDAEAAARLARAPLRLGSAEYRLNNFQGALQAFEKAQGPEADYNRGNTLARLGRYEDAIAAYDKTLQQIPGMGDALANKKAVEKLLQQQQKKQQQQEQKQDKKEGQQGQQDEQQSGQGQSKESQQQEGEQSQGQNGQQQEQGSEGDENPFTKAEEELKKQQEEAGRMQDESPQQNQNTAKGDPEQPPGQREDAESDRDNEQVAQDIAEAMATDSEEGRPTPLTSEEQMAAEQWLRRIPDDPGGLLRRKFLYQYQQRQGRSSTGRQDW